MLRCPNDGYSLNNSMQSSGQNNLNRRFAPIFDQIFSSDYYEGTVSGNYYSSINQDKKSQIYVKDPYEEKLSDFCNETGNSIKYLVGFTGMGKTTLLRNFFGVHDRNVHVTNDTVTIYISFYYANLCADTPQKSVEAEVINYLLLAIRTLGKQNSKKDLNEEEFWTDLYQYIQDNKPTSLQNQDFTPEVSFEDFFLADGEKKYTHISNELKKMCDNNKLEYYSCLLKYLLSHRSENQTIYIIFDDIESKDAIFHRPVVEVARHLHSCFSCSRSSIIKVKTIVALRAYTFRSNIDRKMEARREEIEKNTILKNASASLDKIFFARFDAIEKNLDFGTAINNSSAFAEAKEQLSMIVSTLSSKFSVPIYNLANCNICHVMSMCKSILLNSKWVEREDVSSSGSPGAFKISAEDYRITSKTIFRAIAYGENSTYVFHRGSYFPNLLFNNKEEGGELLNLIVLRYLFNKHATDLYGENYVDRSTIVRDLTNLFTNGADSGLKIALWQERINKCINYLYDNGILLQSIYDIEFVSESNIERQSSQVSKLYISPRGQFLYSLFAQNALLLELYRDSIYVDLVNNDKLSCDMKESEVMNYLLSYIMRLFDFEKSLISEAFQNLHKYQELIGSELLISPLLEGLNKNIDTYFQKPQDDYSVLSEKISSFIEVIDQYIHTVSSSEGVTFCVSLTKRSN